MTSFVRYFYKFPSVLVDKTVNSALLWSRIWSARWEIEQPIGLSQEILACCHRMHHPFAIHFQSRTFFARRVVVCTARESVLDTSDSAANTCILRFEFSALSSGDFFLLLQEDTLNKILWAVAHGGICDGAPSSNFSSLSAPKMRVKVSISQVLHRRICSPFLELYSTV